jgi:hypothetical protein
MGLFSAAKSIVATAAMNFLGGEVVSELNLYTLPTGAVPALDRYRSGDLSGASDVHVGGRGLNFSISW